MPNEAAVWPEGKEKASGFSTRAAKPPMPQLGRVRQQIRLRICERGHRQERSAAEQRGVARPRPAGRDQRQPDDHPGGRVAQAGERPHEAGHGDRFETADGEEERLIDGDQPLPERLFACRRRESHQATSAAGEPSVSAGVSRLPGRRAAGGRASRWWTGTRRRPRRRR